ncbi:MAG: ECF transporter S component [Tissierellia bacterium]|nr:ECF transporter S component [Tissierellia bacterium]
MERNHLRRVIFVGLMAALVCVSTYIRIVIPTPLGPTMLHLGNIMCILSGLILGPGLGFLAAGIGSAIFDLLDPNFAAGFWITFILKGFYGFIVGWIAHSHSAFGRNKKKNTAAAIIGAISYTILYTIKNFITLHLVLGNPIKAVIPVLFAKASVSLGNAIIAVICALFIHEALGKRIAIEKM